MEGGKALGINGFDGSLFTADNGLIQSVNSEIVKITLDNGYIPVISAITSDSDGGVCNLDADVVAAELAISLGAEKLVLLTATQGIFNGENGENEIISELPLSMVRPLIKKGVITGEMVNKVDCCVKVVRKGVHRAHILDGKLAHSILVEMLTDSGIGTMILLE
jgi:acetylglutamate kinase